MPKEAAAVLLIEQELESEDDPEVDVWIERIEASGALAEASWFATTAADRERFRKFRHTLPELVNDTVRRSGALKMNTDYAVPLARNREMLAVLPASPGRRISGPVRDLRAHRRRARSRQPVFRSEQSAACDGGAGGSGAQGGGVGGTVSAEHGLGKRKAHLLAIQYAPEHLETMRAVKRRLDPQNILGRGTIWA